MTELLTDVSPSEGTAAHFLTFLDWAEKKGELPRTTVHNWRNAASKVLEIEASWEDLDLVGFDLEAHLIRFQVLKRTAYTEGSMNAYKSRTKAAIESYRTWLTNPGAADWKPKAGTARGTKGDLKGTNNASGAATSTNGREGRIGGSGLNHGHVPVRAALIEYPFPLRPGVQARVALPEDLNEKEAKRLARFIESLAFVEQLAITAGPDAS